MIISYPDKVRYFETSCQEGCGASWRAYRDMNAHARGRRYVLETSTGETFSFATRGEARKAGQISILKHMTTACPSPGEEEPTRPYPVVPTAENPDKTLRVAPEDYLRDIRQGIAIGAAAARSAFPLRGEKDPDMDWARTVFKADMKASERGLSDNIAHAVICQAIGDRPVEIDLSEYLQDCQEAVKAGADGVTAARSVSDPEHLVSDAIATELSSMADGDTREARWLKNCRQTAERLSAARSQLLSVSEAETA